MLGTSLGINDAEAAAVLQRRHCLARNLDLGGINFCYDDSRLGAGFGEHHAPGIDDQRVTVGLALVLVCAALRGGEYEAAGLDGTRAQQRVPMRLAGLSG